MSAASAADQYPTATLCDECVAEGRKQVDSKIVSVVGYDFEHEGTCEWCGKEVSVEIAV